MGKSDKIGAGSGEIDGKLRHIEYDENGDPIESGFLLDANDENGEAVYLLEEK